ncbi:hypothetical protein IE00_18835 [Paracoccus sp. SM22M-07]|nr:hypothetical protein IE00_18835 [Paracoccus sp. SM22M-07]
MSWHAEFFGVLGQRRSEGRAAQSFACKCTDKFILTATQQIQEGLPRLRIAQKQIAVLFG